MFRLSKADSVEDGWAERAVAEVCGPGGGDMLRPGPALWHRRALRRGDRLRRAEQSLPTQSDAGQGLSAGAADPQGSHINIKALQYYVFCNIVKCCPLMFR